MSNPAPITLEQLFRFWRGLPHQAAAIGELEADLQANGYAVAMRRDRDWFKTWSTDGKQPATGWQSLAEAIVKEFEGCRLQAYRCPAGVWTIGWGATTVDGRLVTEGQRITQQQADQQLQADLRRFHSALMNALPMSSSWASHRQAALSSWCFNVGVGAMQGSTLRRRLLGGHDPDTVVREELPRWDKVEGAALPGLVRRRAAEVALFTGAAPAGSRNPLPVPYYAQLDSTTDQARRMCFSSSCAMLLAFLRPGLLHGPNGDDQYLARVRSFGDTTSAIAQVQALGSYEVKADFTRAADFKLIERQIDAGFPVPCGYLHRGPVHAPTGGGHWLCVVGYTRTHVIVHDPLGEADLVGGTTLGRPARFCAYSKENFGRRWMVEGPVSGWAIVVGRTQPV